MATFFYRALDSHGQEVSGSIESFNRHHVLGFLQKKQLKPIILYETKTNKKQKSQNKTTQKSFRIKNKKKVALLFISKLLQLHSNGLTIGNAVRILLKRIKDKDLQSITYRIWQDLSEGISLANALRKFPEVFNENIINPIEVGETTGNLTSALQDILNYLNAQEALRKSIYASIAYPAFIICISIGLIGFFLFWLLPSLQRMIESMGGSMTLPTKILLGSTHAIILTCPIFILGGIFATVYWFLQRKTPQGRLKTDRWLLKIPILKNILQEAELVNASNLLATLLSSGITLSEAMKLTERSLYNTALRTAFQAARQKINDGLSFTASFQNSNFFPEIALDILTVGESVGTLDKSFLELYKMYSIELNRKFKGLIQWISSLALGVSFGLVAVLALSMITSILQVSQSVISR